MELRSLGYVSVRSSRPEEWDGFATRLLGMRLADRGGARAFRMDDRRQRLLVDPGDDGIGSFGWEAVDAAALDSLAARLDAAGVPVERGSGALANRRHVAGLVAFQDPAGNRLEAFHGAEAADTPDWPISGFRTGPFGMGQAVLHHFVVEPGMLDDIGQGHDLAGLEEGRVAYTLGPAHQRPHDVLLRQPPVRLLRGARLGRADDRARDIGAAGVA